MLVTAGIHGCEFVGIETARRLAIELAGRSGAVRGTVTIVACVNPGAMRARIPALNPADGLNINRMFPGDAGGSASQRTATWLMELQSESDFYIDMHAATSMRSSRPTSTSPAHARSASRPPPAGPPRS